jgi:catechol 2,3-dioxygenase
MKLSKLGHVALKVTDMERAKQFYHGVLELPYSGEHNENKMVFFRADDHHNLALFLSDKIDITASSLDHVAFQLQGGKRELDLAQVELESIGIDVTPYEHEEVHSLYFGDPDGNQIELYVHHTV